MGRRAIVATAVLGFSGALFVLWQRDGPGTPDTEPHPEVLRDHMAEQRLHERSEDYVRHDPTDRESMLIVHVDSNGKQAAGNVTFATGAAPETLHSRLSSVQFGEVDAKGVISEEFVGSFELRVPAHHWTWLRVNDREHALVGFLRVPPFEGRLTRHMTLHRDRRVLHVLMYAADYKPADRGRKVLLYTNEVHAPLEAAYKEFPTGEGGYVAIRDLAPGAYLLCAEGASPKDGPPHVARLVSPPRSNPTEMTCTLVMPEPREWITVNVLVSGAFGPSIASRRFKGAPATLVTPREPRLAARS